MPPGAGDDRGVEPEMLSAKDAFARLSGETKALILASEYRLGKADQAALAELLDLLVSSDLERIGILELVRRQSMKLGMSQEQANALSDALSGVTELPPAPNAGAAASKAGDRTIRPHRTETTSFNPGAPKPVDPQIFNVTSVETLKLRRQGTGPVPSPAAPAAAPTAPAAPAPAPAAKPVTQAPPAAAASQTFYGSGAVASFAMKQMATKKILLADDDARIRMVFGKKLSESGYLVDEAGDGQQAWDKLQSNNYALAILDMKMPGLHGLELLGRLTAAGAKVPVIICSAYEQLREEFVVSTYPKLRYLVKPVPIEKLLQAAKELTAAAD